MSSPIESNRSSDSQRILRDLKECQRFAVQVASVVRAPMTIALSGTLGAGKTQWTRFFATELGAPPQTISSPTFVLVHQYPSQPPIFHIDAYRVGDEDELLDLGIEEMMDSEAITVIEWADRFPQLLPRDCLSIHFDLGTDSDHRIVSLRATGPRSQDILNTLVSSET